VNRIAGAKVTVFGSHGLVLLHLARQPDGTMREMAQVFGVSERRIARILRDLTDAGMISVTKHGKRNAYAINEDAPCVHPSIGNLNVGDIVRAALPAQPDLIERESEAHQAERRAPVGLLQGLLLPFLATDGDAAVGLLPAILPLLA
jgi:hypothetical protein